MNQITTWLELDWTQPGLAQNRSSSSPSRTKNPWLPLWFFSGFDWRWWVAQMTMAYSVIDDLCSRWKSPMISVSQKNKHTFSLSVSLFSQLPSFGRITTNLSSISCNSNDRGLQQWTESLNPLFSFSFEGSNLSNQERRIRSATRSGRSTLGSAATTNWSPIVCGTKKTRKDLPLRVVLIPLIRNTQLTITCRIDHKRHRLFSQRI